MPGSDLRGVAHAHIVFCAAAAASAHLDCVSESEDTAGWPFALIVDLPEGAEWSVMAARLLGRWADDASRLAIRVEPHPATSRVRLSDGESAVRLDLVEVRLDPVV